MYTRQIADCYPDNADSSPYQFSMRLLPMLEEARQFNSAEDLLNTVRTFSSVTQFINSLPDKSIKRRLHKVLPTSDYLYQLLMNKTLTFLQRLVITEQRTGLDTGSRCQSKISALS